MSSAQQPLLKLCHQQRRATLAIASQRQSVSSKDLLEANLEANDHLDNWCGGIQVGQDLCLPAQCKLHLVTPDDSCDSVTVEYGVSLENLSEWNPKVYIQCDGLNKTISGFICVGPPIGQVVQGSHELNAQSQRNVTRHDPPIN
ncbi:LysM domain-containing protein [Colletotrichum kahawae]|uniref:LysM domain-containing protein n=1 Tax=Colletotrichum kahawae TaxID=34407 RepID=A0AAD9YIX3_COLKA|nr:LysM domain-containing protein [Colletotrichum kahawae]